MTRTVYEPWPPRRFSWRRVAIIASLTAFCGVAWIAVGYGAMWMLL